MKAAAAILASLVLVAAASAATPDRPRLQIINGSDQIADIYWLKSDTERVPSGSVAPGKWTLITTTLGHRFEVVGRDDHATAPVTSTVRVQAFRFDPATPDGVPAFYTQRLSAGGFPIVASAKVNPYALKEAAYILDQMLDHRPDVRAAMIQSGARLCIMAHNEYTTDLPEFAWLGEVPERGFEDLPAKDYRDARARGMGGSPTDPCCSCAEENVLGYPGDPYATECILIHEFAHNIHLRGMVNVDPTFDTRLKAAYDAAIQQGLWKGKYASVNHHEYFAEGVQSYFNNNRVNDHDHNHVNTRALLVEYDPRLAALCREVFGYATLKYTKPATRLTGHMAGYNPAAAPTFTWPARLLEAKRKITAAAIARDKAAQTTAAAPVAAEASAFTTTKDIAYGPAERQKLDVYAPEGAKNLPVFIWIHGGGWQTGDKSSVHEKPRVLTGRGMVFVSLGYRLFPHVDMKTLTRDVAQGVGWVNKHIAEHGGDPNRMIIGGHSAGAQLAALLCCDESYLKAEGVSLKQVKGCVPVDGDTFDIPMRIATGVAERRRLNKPEPKTGHREKFGGTEALFKEFSAVYHIASGKNIPPFLTLCVADHVETSAQAYRLHEALVAAGVPSTVHGARETDHGRINANLGQGGDSSTLALYQFLDGVLK